MDAASVVFAALVYSFLQEKINNAAAAVIVRNGIYFFIILF
jgi:hypothetical protein